MTLEEELALIQKNKAPAAAPIASPADAPVASLPAADPADKIDADLGLAPSETGLPPLPQTDAGTWDILGAAWHKATIQGDVWNYNTKKREALAQDMFDLLSPEAQQSIRARLTKVDQDWTSFENQVIEQAQADAAASPDAASKWAEFPMTPEDFTKKINTELTTEFSQDQSILDQPGGGVSEFVGSAARGMTTPFGLLTAPIGGVGTGWKFFAGEFLAGAFANAIELPVENRVAQDLNLPEPDALTSILIGGAAQAGFAGILAAGAKYIPKGYRKIVGLQQARKDSIAAATPDNGDRLGTEVAIDKAEADLRGESSVQSRIAVPLGPIAGAENLPYNEGAVLRGIIGTESGGRANAANPNSSAYGAGQFISSTWLNMVRKYRPDLATGKTDSEILSLRGDAKISVEMTAMYTRENAATLSSNGIATDPGALYMAHFMGPGGAVKAMKASLDTPISALMSAKEIAANANIRFGGKSFADFTAGDLRRWAAHKMRGAYDPNASRDLPVYGGTSRGYTGNDQVSTGSGSKIDVTYEVVDLSSLQRATGDLQPRDRSRGNSDAWIADTAARLDPAQLMPSPTADRGTPIVGTDGIIDSGNGRASAIARAYEYHPDRAAAYRARIEAEGFAIPDGVTRPVLIARRTTDLSHEDRVRFAIDAQDSGVAVMTPTEVARTSSRAMTSPVLGQLDPAQPLTAEANAGFVRAALASLPRSARNAMFDAAGLLNRNGERQLREAIFARAWNDPDIIEMFTEADQGDLKSLMEALGRAAPSWAALKADIEAGLVRPEMDISAHVLDAMRLIAAARKLAGRDGVSIGKALTDLLDDVDMIDGAVSPLVSAMVKKFWRNGRSASADDVATFLTRYADDARKAGAEGGMFDAPGPQDVLRAIDKEAFGDLPADLGQPRSFARPGQVTPSVETVREGYDAGAASPEIEADDAAVRDALEAPSPTAADSPAVPRQPEDPAAAAMQADLAAARTAFSKELDALEIDMPDGTTASFREILDDLDADAQTVAGLRACAIGGA